MQTIYEHKQIGTAMLIIYIPVLGALAAIGITGGRTALPLLIIILVFLFATMLAFSSLTVRVDAQQVSFHFGLGFWRRTVSLRQISEVRVVRSALWDGLGIHFIPGGILYNVSGLDAVELALEKGRKIRIGSDEPSALAQAIEEARRLQR